MRTHLMLEADAFTDDPGHHREDLYLSLPLGEALTGTLEALRDLQSTLLSTDGPLDLQTLRIALPEALTETLAVTLHAGIPAGADRAAYDAAGFALTGPAPQAGALSRPAAAVMLELFGASVHVLVDLESAPGGAPGATHRSRAVRLADLCSAVAA